MIFRAFGINFSVDYDFFLLSILPFLLFFVLDHFFFKKSIVSSIFLSFLVVIADFVATLVHELGHAIAARAFVNATNLEIRFLSDSAVTMYQGWGDYKSILLVNLAGPLLPIVLLILFYFIFKAKFKNNPRLGFCYTVFFYYSLFSFVPFTAQSDIYKALVNLSNLGVFGSVNVDTLVLSVTIAVYVISWLGLHYLFDQVVSKRKEAKEIVLV